MVVWPAVPVVTVVCWATAPVASSAAAAPINNSFFILVLLAAGCGAQRTSGQSARSEREERTRHHPQIVHRDERLFMCIMSGAAQPRLATIATSFSLRFASINNEEGMRMKKTALVLATVGALGVSAVAAPTPAEARWRGGWGGWGPGLAGGLIAGAVIGGLASSA